MVITLPCHGRDMGSIPIEGVKSVVINHRLKFTKQSSRYKNELSATVFISIVAMLLKIQPRLTSVSDYDCCKL